MNVYKACYRALTLICICACLKAKGQPVFYKNLLAYTLHEYAEDYLLSTDDWYLKKCRDHSPEEFKDACIEFINASPQNKIDPLSLLHKMQKTLQRTIEKSERIQRDTYDWYELRGACVSLLGSSMLAYGTYEMYRQWRKTRVSDQFLKLMEQVNNDFFLWYRHRMAPPQVIASGVVSMAFFVLAAIQIKEGLHPLQEENQYLDTYKQFLHIINQLIEIHSRKEPFDRSLS